MRQIIIFTIFFFFLSGLTVSYGQKSIGFKLGLNVSDVRNSNGSGFTNLLSFNTGIVARFKLRDKLNLNYELLLSNKGFNSILIPGGTTATNLTYLTLPGLFEYHPIKKLYLQLGPELDYLINARMKGKNFNEKILDNYKKVDFAIISGVGFEICKRFNLETRYSLGLYQIRQNKNIFGSYYNRTFQVNLTYFLKSRSKSGVQHKVWQKAG